VKKNKRISIKPFIILLCLMMFSGMAKSTGGGYEFSGTMMNLGVRY